MTININMFYDIPKIAKLTLKLLYNKNLNLFPKLVDSDRNTDAGAFAIKQTGFYLFINRLLKLFWLKIVRLHLTTYF